MNKKNKQYLFRRLVVGTLFLPFLLFAFYSVGTMPAYGKQGIETVICSGTSLQTVYLNENGVPVEKTLLKHCDFASQIQVMAVLALLPLREFVFLSGTTRYFLKDSFYISASAYRHFFARAPPLSV